MEELKRDLSFLAENNFFLDSQVTTENIAEGIFEQNVAESSRIRLSWQRTINLYM